MTNLAPVPPTASLIIADMVGRLEQQLNLARAAELQAVAVATKTAAARDAAVARRQMAETELAAAIDLREGYRLT